MSRSQLFNGLNVALGLVQKLRPSSVSFDMQLLHEKAIDVVGSDDFGADYYRTSLQRLLDSLENDANLNPYGKVLLQRTVHGGLVNRLLLAKMKQQDPEIFAQPIRAPIIVTGLPRTGTTSLHRLLAADPNHRGVPYWELVSPMPWRRGDGTDQRQARAKKMLSMRSLITPELDAIHYIRADSTEECLFMNAMTFESRLFWNLASVNGYLDWYKDADREAKYQDYADLLKVLQANQPGRRLVLKAPEHVDALDALLKAVPNAMVVQTHRNPVAQLGSYLSLGRMTRSMSTDKLDIRRDTDSQLALTDASVNRILVAREGLGDQVFDVQYDQLIANPLQQLNSIYAHFDLPLSSVSQQAVRQHSSKNKQNKHGRHGYSLEEYGLSQGQIKERYSQYSERFLHA